MEQAPALERIAASLAALEERLAPRLPAIDFSAHAFRWVERSNLGDGYLQAIDHVNRIAPEDLHQVEVQKEQLLRNTEQFVRGLPANHVLLTGARGCGKSSLVRACLTRFAAQGLRLIEVDKQDLVHIAKIAACVADRPERFIVFCDDLSFDEGEGSYKALKSALDGSIAAAAENLLIYATSNRRHLMPESMRENLQATFDEDGELHPAETTEEKISLSERFGLWLSFYPFRQDDYLAIVAHWLKHFSVPPERIVALRAEALQFALGRGSRSGRVALQFARAAAGQLGLEGAPSH